MPTQSDHGQVPPHRGRLNVQARKPLEEHCIIQQLHLRAPIDVLLRVVILVQELHPGGSPPHVQFRASTEHNAIDEACTAVS